MDNFRLNHKLVRKTYLLPRIVKKMHKLEDLHYSNTLDMRMGYYTIRHYPESKDMKKIVTEFGRFIYNCLPMGMCTSGDICHAKVYKIIGDIEGVKK